MPETSKSYRMKKPRKLKTAKWVYGINVEGKDVIDVPSGYVKDFLKLGFRFVSEKKKEKKGGK